MPQPQGDNTFLVFYPIAARAAGVDGEATLRCARTLHLALTGCTIVSETPAGQGFGAAAMNMAAQSKDNPKLTLTDPQALAPQELTVHFQLRPPRITPDITAMAHIVTAPEIVTKPTKAQIQAAYPVRALDDQVEGGAVIDCIVNEAGSLEGCRVGAENPPGYGFGQAAVDLAGDFVMKPGRFDGDPVGGRPVRISVAFTTPDPTAPLSLGTKPNP
jgi:TonB family protein